MPLAEGRFESASRGANAQGRNLHADLSLLSPSLNGQFSSYVADLDRQPTRPNSGSRGGKLP